MDHLRNICILISLYFSFSCGYVRFFMHPTVYPVGKTNLSFKCGSPLYYFMGWKHINASLKLQLRNYSNDNWTSVFELNGANEFKENKSASFDGYTILSLNWTNGTYTYSNIKQITLEGSVEPKQCTVDPQKSPGVRCVLSGGSQIIDSSEKKIFSIEGRTPEKMENISIVSQGIFQDKDKINFEEDDVLQLQCIGEVETINGIPSKNIRWCKNESGKLQKLSLQHPPLTSIVSRIKDGCSVVQKSVIFYHILKNDTDLDLMCESGYGGTCGKSGINYTISIPTANTNEDKWRVSPIVIHDRESVLNKNLIKLNGAGKTLYLLCTASTLFQQESLQVLKMFNYKNVWNLTVAQLE
ncbi:uncharacterized protein [Magallana gigas]|uniref:uncharacterized protein n=1 Tax=Magallana gigas TaxID=29159 RepID=UPI00333FCC26